VNTKLAGNNLSDATVKICVLGAGAFGTAMATVAARNNHEGVIYARDHAVVDSLNNDHINPKVRCGAEYVCSDSAIHLRNVPWPSLALPGLPWLAPLLPLRRHRQRHNPV